MTYTILVAVDGDPDHRAAIDWAAARAARDGARLELIHVIDRSWGDSGEQPARLLELAGRTRLSAEGRVAARRTRAVLGLNRVPATGGAEGEEEDPGIDIHGSLRFGHLAHELIAASEAVDMLVLGTPAEAERQRAFAGSVAVRVAGAAACTVAAVPHGWQDRARGVVVGVDGDLPSEPAVAFAAAEAAATGDPLTVVCAGFATADPLLESGVVEGGPEDRRVRIVAEAAEQAEAARPGIVVFRDVVDTSPASGVVAEAEDSRLLVVGTHDRHGVKRMMLGSVGHDVLLNTRTPVVVVRGRRSEAPER